MVLFVVWIYSGWFVGRCWEGDGVEDLTKRKQDETGGDRKVGGWEIM